MLVNSKNALSGVALALTTAAGVAMAQGSAFQGLYVNSDGNTETIQCINYQTLTTTSTYAACCRSACMIITAAVGPLGIDYFGSTTTCNNDGSDFHTMTIYDQAPPAGPDTTPTAQLSYVQYMCTDAWEASTLYRRLADDTTTTSSGLTASPTSPSSPSSTSSQPSATNASSPASSAPPAWIAGAVAGPVVAIAAIGAIALCLARRKRAARRQPVPSVATDSGEVTAYLAAATMSPETSQKHLSTFQPAYPYDQNRWTMQMNGGYQAYQPIPSPSPSHLSPVSFAPPQAQELPSTREEPELQQLP